MEKTPKDNLKWLYTLSETIIHHRKILKIVFESLKIPDSESFDIMFSVVENFSLYVASKEIQGIT